MVGAGAGVAFERDEGTVHMGEFSRSLLLNPGVSVHTFSTFGTMGLPVPRTLTKNGIRAGEQEWCSAGEGFGSGQPGLCGKVFSTG